MDDEAEEEAKPSHMKHMKDAIEHAMKDLDAENQVGINYIYCVIYHHTTSK